MIEIENLFISYADKNILDDISLNIGSSCSILGNNGSGKSSFAKALSGLLPYNGSIRIDNKEVSKYEVKELAKKIAYIPTKLDIYDKSLNVFEFVLFSRYAYKKSFFDFSKEDKMTVGRTLASLGIESLENLPLHTLSSGESALVLIAAALVTQSQIVIFDEPTANLDPKNAQKIAKIIKELQKTHQIVCITHDIKLAKFLGFDILFIREQKMKSFSYRQFFCDEMLSKLYDVPFVGLEVFYD